MNGYAEGPWPAQIVGDLSTGGILEQVMTVRTAGGGPPGENRHRKKRLRLSCGECSKKKVIDRFPYLGLCLNIDCYMLMRENGAAVVRQELALPTVRTVGAARAMLV